MNSGFLVLLLSTLSGCSVAMYSGSVRNAGMRPGETSGVGEIGNGGQSIRLALPALSGQFVPAAWPGGGTAVLLDQRHSGAQTQFVIYAGACSALDFSGNIELEHRPVLAHSTRSLVCDSGGCDFYLDQAQLLDGSGAPHPGFHSGRYCAKAYTHVDQQSVSCAMNLILKDNGNNRTTNPFECRLTNRIPEAVSASISQSD